MKLSSLLLLFTVLQVLAVDSYSQHTKLTLDLKDVTVEDALKTIEDQSEFFFLYSPKMVDVFRKVDIKLANKKVDFILNQMFAGTGVGYIIKDRQIVITTDEMIQPFKKETLQQIVVTGKVTDEDGNPLPGVNIIIKGTLTGGITDLNGNYSIEVGDPEAVLVFTFIGMLTQEIKVGDQTEINITMARDVIGLEEVVAIGYGTMKKDELTSSVASVKIDGFIKGSVSDAAQLITGKVAGLHINRPNANPVSTSQIMLRGVTTLMSGAQPLVLIDGIPGNLTTVAPEDIESIDVLKDGSAAAIYGTRGTNGVILITTSKIKRDIPPTIEYKTYASVQQITKKLDILTAEEYRKLAAEGKPGTRDDGANTDWIDEIMRTPLSHVHNLSIKGGKVNSNYIINLNYKKIEGIVKKSDNIVFTPRLEINHSMFDGKLRINANILGQQQKYWSGWNDRIYEFALLDNPTSPIKDEYGNWYEDLGRMHSSNPVAWLEETKGEIVNNKLRTFGSLIYSPIANFDLKLVGSHDISNCINGYSQTMQHISTVRDSRNGYASRSTNKGLNDLIEFTTQYSKSLKNHFFTALAGYSWQENTYENFGMSNFDFPTDKYSYNNMITGLALKDGRASMYSYKEKTKLIGYFFRMRYNYKGKYMLMASIRHEGSSKFGSDHKWANFPAISAGWNLKNESFLEKVNLINNLKIRVGYGITGTAPSSPYMSQSRLKYGNYYLLNGVWSPVIYPSTNPNTDLRWEKKAEINIGSDFAILDNRISGTLDLYQRTTKDLIWNYNVPSPPYLYNTIVANAGSMENKGIEINLNFVPIKTTNFNWTSTINYSTNKNRLVSLSSERFIVQGGFFETGWISEPIQVGTHRIEEGGKIGNFWALEAVDIDSDGYWIILGEGEDGIHKPIFEQTASDKRVVGNGLPKHYASWNNTLRYKNFDMEINMRGAFKFQIINYARIFMESPVNLGRGNALSTVYHDVFGKRPLNDMADFQYLSYYVEDGDYWKIDNITIGYNLNIMNTFIKRLRVYASCLNLMTFTGYSGIDPEVNIIGLAPGADFRDRYPSSRTFTLGANITF